MLHSIFVANVVFYSATLTAVPDRQEGQIEDMRSKPCIFRTAPSEFLCVHTVVYFLTNKGDGQPTV